MSAQPILSQSAVAMDGKWEGWCWYPDRPAERAVVDLFVGDRSIRAVRAARLRTDLRDLGMGDGYCGFQLPLPHKEQLSGHAVAEVRERRFGRVIGRVVLGENALHQAKHLRLTSASVALRAAEDALTVLTTMLPRRAAPLAELGTIMSHLSRHPRPSTSVSEIGALATCQAALDRVRPVRLGWCRSPRVTLVVRAAAAAPRGVEALADDLRRAAQAMQNVGAEMILVDDGTEPRARFLPGRVRHLGIVRSSYASPCGCGLNAAALAARGTWLAFARADGVRAAELSDAVSGAAQGTVYLETSAADPQAVAQSHRLQALVSRSAFHAMGGLDPLLEEPDVWAEFLSRAMLIDQRIVRWKSIRDGALRPMASRHD